MLTIHLRDTRGYPVDVQWYCDGCEVAELTRRDLPPVRQGAPVTRTTPDGTETLTHSAMDITPWCMACEDTRGRVE